MKIKTVSILGLPIAVLTMEEVLNWAEAKLESQEVAQIITANAEIIYRAYRDPQLADLFKKAAVITADGAGVVWASEKLNTPLPERVTGVDLTQRLLALASQKNWSVYFLGAKPEVVKQAVLRTLSKYPHLQIVGYQHGYFCKQEISQIVSKIQQAKPDLLLVAMGAPRQEIFIQEYLPQLNTKLAMGVGGTFDILAGTAARAPLWMQKHGLEWFYRLCRQPWRIGRMLSLPRFIMAVYKQKRASSRLDKS
jgi:N-acetylglucosaminyldiphosphoundecaprenol N-acetyl-beta-D-mannosaminyltransferase